MEIQLKLPPMLTADYVWGEFNEHTGYQPGFVRILFMDEPIEVLPVPAALFAFAASRHDGKPTWAQDVAEELIRRIGVLWFRQRLGEGA